MKGIKRLAEMLEGQKDKYLIIIVNHLMLQTEMNEAFLNEEKNLKDMATYIKDTAKKQAKNGGIYIDEDIMDNYFFYILINCSYDVFSYIRRK